MYIDTDVLILKFYVSIVNISSSSIDRLGVRTFELQKGKNNAVKRSL